MIVVKEFPNKQFNTKEELFKALRENKNSLIAQKKAVLKEADAILFSVGLTNDKSDVVKASIDNIADVNAIKGTLIINTTNILDSHNDVHLKGIWNKSVKEAKNILHLQEHKMTFDHIISDKVTASVQEMKWSDLGYSYKGTTEALVFDSEIEKARNEYMFNQYAKGFVKEHSVGMRYVKLELAINSDAKYDVEEKEIWDKYINEIVNKEAAEEMGYFWAVQEAKVIEGSAVVKGSNSATPTQNIEAVKSTSNAEPSKDTQKKNFYLSLLK